MNIQPPTPTSTTAPVVRARRGALAAVAALACAALLGACGSSSSSSSGTTATVDVTRVAASIEESILKERHIHATVVCPTAVPQVKGQTFECIATSHSPVKPYAEIKTPFVVTVQTNKGYVTYVGK